MREKDVVISKEDFYAKIDCSLKQSEKGKVIRQCNGETVEEFIARLTCSESIEQEESE